MCSLRAYVDQTLAQIKHGRNCRLCLLRQNRLHRSGSGPGCPCLWLKSPTIIFPDRHKWAGGVVLLLNWQCRKFVKQLPGLLRFFSREFIGVHNRLNTGIPRVQIFP